MGKIIYANGSEIKTFDRVSQLSLPLLPPSANMYGWWNAENAYSDAGATLCSVGGDGTTCYQLTDLSSNGNHLIQSTAGARPAWKINQKNGLPALDFNSSKSIRKTGLSYSTMSFHVVYYITSIIHGDWNIGGHGGGNAEFKLSMATSPIRLVANGASQVIAGSGYWYLVSFCVENYTNCRLLVDTNTLVSGSTGSSANYTDVFVGADSSPFVAAEVLTYSTYHNPTTGDGLLVRQFLNSKYALGLSI